MRKLGIKMLFLLGLLSLFLVIFTGKQTVQAATNGFNYQNGTTSVGNQLVNGQAKSNTYNYNYGDKNNTDGVAFDDEDYVNYGDKAYLQKSVAENTAKQGLFDVSLAIKGNNLAYPVDVVLVMDYSSTMKGEKLNNAINGVSAFLNEISDVMANGDVRVAMVTYNRKVTTTENLSDDGFVTDADLLTNFMKTAPANTGTFTQAGLMAGERLLEGDSKEEARKILVHIGDGSVNQAYQPVSGATPVANNDQIVSVGKYQAADSYLTEYQTEAARLIYKSSDPTNQSGIDANEVAGEDYLLVDGTTDITNYTLGTILDMKNKGIDCYSIGVNPSDRGNFVAQNIASDPAKYRTIDENLSDLGDALGAVASQVDNTIANGTVTDPMGQDILLQKQDENFTAGRDYTLTGERLVNGVWVAAPDLLNNVAVTENNGTISLSGLRLGKDEKVVLTYQVRIDTESANFQPETWYLANGRTTLDPDVAYEEQPVLYDFPIPSIKAPGVTLNLAKKWTNENKLSKRPTAINYVITRTANTATGTNKWDTSAQMSLNQANNWQAEISSVVPANGSQKVALAKYNNVGDDYQYSASEINVPAGYENSVSVDGNQITLVNKWTEEEPQEPKPTPEPEPQPEPKPDPEPGKPDPGTVEKEQTTKKETQQKLPQANEQRSNTGTVVGAILLIIVVILGGWWYKRRRNNQDLIRLNKFNQLLIKLLKSHK